MNKELKKYIVIAALCFMGFLIGCFVFVSQSYQRKQSLDVYLSLLKKEKILISTITDKSQQLSGQISKVNMHVPKKMMLEDLVLNIKKIAAQNHLSVNSLQPGNEIILLLVNGGLLSWFEFVKMLSLKNMPLMLVQYSYQATDGGHVEATFKVLS